MCRSAPGGRRPVPSAGDPPDRSWTARPRAGSSPPPPAGAAARRCPPSPHRSCASMDRLGSLQFDPLDIAGRNHDLVLAARIAGLPARLDRRAAVRRARSLYEAYNKGLSIVPTAELPWYRVTWDRSRGAATTAAPSTSTPPSSTELLDRIRRDGPLAVDRRRAARGDRLVLAADQPGPGDPRGAGRGRASSGSPGATGNRRVYDLAERLFPAALLAETRPLREQRRHKLLSRYRAHGLLGRSGSAELWSGIVADDAWRGGRDRPARGATAGRARGGRHARAGGRRGRPGRAVHARRGGADPRIGGRPGRRRAVSRSCGGVAFLAPLDPFVWDRDLLRALYDFDYVWEVYVPAAKRRWGYYVLPILFGDRLVGRIEPRIDRRAGVLRVLGLWWEAGLRAARRARLRRGLRDALEAHATVRRRDPDRPAAVDAAAGRRARRPGPARAAAVGSGRDG